MEKPTDTVSCPLIAIGASAGGVKALEQLFRQLRPDTGACFVVIMHLDPHHESRLPQILEECTNMPVAMVKDREEIGPNRVYVIPPDRRLHIEDNHIKTSSFDPLQGVRAPIDLFFRSLADHSGDGIAVILTGAGSDGLIGAKAIKQAGGIVLVQDPEEADYPSMPRTAIEAGVADLVLPVSGLTEELDRLMQSRTSLASEVEDDDGGIINILRQLRARVGHDFTQYKRSTVTRRVRRRMQIARTTSLDDYAEYLKGNPDEAQQLFADLLISVTTFFRDQKAYEALTQRVIPALFHNKDAENPVRVWIAGCATGEEAYSIAMLLYEEAARQQSSAEIQIFASDLDASAIAQARRGVYPIAIEADVSEARLKRHFIREGQFYRVRPEIRDLVLFASHSLLNDPPFSRVDLISCRNVIIYLDRDLQERVISTLHYGLAPGGFLFLGPSENADSPNGLFRTFDREARIFQAINRGERRLLTFRPSRAASSKDSLRADASTTWDKRLARQPREGELHRRALESLAPPSILVDEALHVLNVSERAGRYLQHPPGPPTSDLVDLARPELRNALRSGLQNAFDENIESLSLPIPVRFNGAPLRVYLQVKPVRGEDASRTALVMFIEGGPVEQSIAEVEQEGDKGESNEELQQLRGELQALEMRLRTSQDDEETTTAELRAANEELQSMNEEYRSTAEELETSQEELQSVNEELQTLNSELNSKLESISRAHNDLQNLMASTDFATLFLDSDLRINRITPKVETLFNISEGDYGRPITDFTHHLDYDGLEADARAVLDDLIPRERELPDRSGAWYLTRLRPYRTSDNKIEGVVITIVDITRLHEAEKALRESETRLKLAREAAEIGIHDYNPQTGACWWDDRARALWDIEAEETVTMELVWSRVHQEDLPVAKAAFEASLNPKGDGVYETEFRIRTGAQEDRWISARGKTFFSGEGVNRHPQRLVVTVRDISDRKAWEMNQKLLLTELSHRVKNTLAIVQSIARQTFRRSANKEQSLKAFEGRLNALSTAHDLLVLSNWEGAELEPLARHQLGAQLSDNQGRIRLEGPRVILPADLATPFGLLLHELGTNAMKYGALSNENGTISVTWHLHQRKADLLLEVHWREEGAPPPDKNPGKGLGSQLIEKGMPGAEVEREINDDGIAYHFKVPLPTRSA